MKLTTFLSGTALALSLAAPAAALDSTGALVIALSSDVNTLDPHMTASIGSDLSVASHLYPSLVLRGSDMELHGNLAESWEAVDDHTWHFKLKAGAKFSNGEVLDAAAVKWNFARVQNPDLGSRVTSWFRNITEVNVIDPSTIEFKTGTPFPSLPAQVSMFFLLPPEWAAANNPANAVMPGGAYTLENRVPGSSITLVANPDYWGDAPEFDRVVFTVMPEAASRSAALEAGEVDYISKIPVLEVERLRGVEGLDVGSLPSTRTVFLKINTRKAPMENKLFRQALNYAVDKEAIVQAIYGGLANVAPCQVMSDDYFGYNPNLEAYPYDPDRAMDLIKQSGVDTSQPIEIDVPVNTYLQGEEASQAIAAMYEAIGLKVKISEMSFGTYMDKQVKAKDLAQLGYLTYAWPTLDAGGLLELFTPGNAYDYWDSEAMGNLIDAAAATGNEAERLALYTQATELMCEEAPIVFLYGQPEIYGTGPDVTWSMRGDDWVRASDFHKN